MKNILIPTDFSENSWNAIKYALLFFKKTPCNFYLLHVTLIPNYAAGDVPIIPTETVLENTLLKQAKKGLKQLQKKIQEKKDKKLKQLQEKKLKKLKKLDITLKLS